MRGGGGGVGVKLKGQEIKNLSMMNSQKITHTLWSILQKLTEGEQLVGLCFTGMIIIYKHWDQTEIIMFPEYLRKTSASN